MPLSLEEISEKSHRDAYAKILEIIELVKSEEKRLLSLPETCFATSICETSGFQAYGFIDYYNKYKTFSDKQMKFITDVYRRIITFREANLEYARQGHKKELICLLEEMAGEMHCEGKSKGGRKGHFVYRANGLKKGDPVSKYFFGYIIRNYVELVQEEKRQDFVNKLNSMCDRYQEIYKKKFQELQ